MTSATLWVDDERDGWRREMPTSDRTQGGRASQKNATRSLL